MARLNPNSLVVLEERYLRKDHATGELLETPDDLFRRVATCVARVETTPEAQARYQESYYKLLNGLYFMPNTPALINAGKPDGQLSACFSIPVEDSMESIFTAVKHMALIHQTGGGTGFSFSRLREEGAIVKSTGRSASGPVTFILPFDAATETVKQGGVRRGANMGTLRVDHPDIFQFIAAKSVEGKFSNFNFSVGLTDKFMEALENQTSFDLVSPVDKRVVRQVPAAEIMQALVDNAWAKGEPGALFLDTINRGNTLQAVGEIETTNPCGEIPLLPYESCNLGAINMTRHLTKDARDNWQVDYPRLEQTVRLGVRFLDSIIEANKFPLPEIEAATKANRKIGLGIMGWADMLLPLQVRYDSEANLELIDQVMGRIFEWADDESRLLGREKGPFPNSNLADETVQGRRNATLTTIAPTGTTSIIAGVSNGIEPLFGFCQVGQHKIVSQILVSLNPLVRRWCQEQDVDLTDFQLSLENLDEARAEVGRLNQYLLKVLPDYFITAPQISPEWHVRVQAAFQRYVCNAVSKTINLPNEATKKDVESVYLLGHKLGLKGLTVYRDGSREEQVIYTKAKNAPTERLVVNPEEMEAKRYLVKTENGDTAYLCVPVDTQGCPWEVFTMGGFDSLSNQCDVKAIFRLVSIALRGGIEPTAIIRQLDKANKDGKGHMFSVPALVSRVLKKALGKFSAGVCEKCGSVIRHEGGCTSCDCGLYTRCG